MRLPMRRLCQAWLAGSRVTILCALEHDPEKWIPVFGKRSCSANKLERDDDSKKSHPALAVVRMEVDGAPPDEQQEERRISRSRRRESLRAIKFLAAPAWQVDDLIEYL